MFVVVIFAVALAALNTFGLSFLDLGSIGTGFKGTLLEFIRTQLWWMDWVIVTSCLISVVLSIKNLFFENRKEVWRPFVMLLITIPWIIPLIDIFHQWVFLSVDLHAANGYGSPDMLIFHLSNLLFLVFTLLIAAIPWFAIQAATNLRGRLPRKVMCENRRIMKQRAKEKKREEKKRKKQVMEEAFGMNKDAESEADAAVETIPAEESTAEVSSSNKSESDGEVKEEKPHIVTERPLYTKQQLNIRFVVAAVLLVIFWFLAMWTCDQGMVQLSTLSERFVPAFGIMSLADFSGIAASVYQAFMPMAQKGVSVIPHAIVDLFMSSTVVAK